MRHQLAGKAWGSWVSMWKDAKRVRAVLFRVKQKMTLSCAAKALRSWVTFVHEQHFLRTLMRRVIASFEHGRLAPGFRTWVRFVRDADAEEARRRRADVILDRCRRRMRNHLAAKAMGAWTHHTEDRKRLRTLAKRIIKRFTGNSIFPALTQWKCVVKEARLSEDAELRREVTLERCRRRILNHALAKAFGSWHHFREQRRYARSVVGRVVGHLENRNYSMPFRSWVEFVEEEKAYELKLLESEVIVERCRRRWLKNTLARAHAAWCFMVAERQRLRTLIKKAVGRMKSGLIGRGFRAWVRNADALRALRERDVAASARTAARYWFDASEARFDLQLRRSAFGAFKQLRRQRAAARARAARWARAKRRTRQTRCFREWKNFRSRRKEAMAPTLRAALRALDCECTRLRRRGFNIWLHVIDCERMAEAHWVRGPERNFWGSFLREDFTAANVGRKRRDRPSEYPRDRPPEYSRRRRVVAATVPRNYPRRRRGGAATVPRNYPRRRRGGAATVPRHLVSPPSLAGRARRVAPRPQGQGADCD